LSKLRPILIVDGDAASRASLAEHLGLHTEFGADQAGSAAEAAAKLAAAGGRHAAILLDAGLPDADGRDFCARLREGGLKVPIVMLTGTDADGQAVGELLDAGANDCVAKPVRTAELLARVRAQLRTFDASEDAAYPVGPYVFRPAAKLLADAAGRGRIRLAGRENAVLRLLCIAAGRAVPRCVLLDAVWGADMARSTRVLDVCIHGLRRKIEPDPSRPRLLLTATNGYLLASADAADRRTFHEAFLSEGGV